MYENTMDITIIINSGFSTLHTIPKWLRAYFRLTSLEVSSWITNKYCFFSAIYDEIPFILFRIMLRMLS